MCGRAQCTSPTGAREPAGTRRPASLVQTAAEGCPGEGDVLFFLVPSYFVPYHTFSCDIDVSGALRKFHILLFCYF